MKWTGDTLVRGTRKLAGELVTFERFIGDKFLPSDFKKMTFPLLKAFPQTVLRML